jgi:hypothetical protein
MAPIRAKLMQLRTEVEIAAPAARIWSLLSEVRRYPEWNPFILRVDGDLAQGGTVTLHLGSSEGRERSVQALVTALEAPRELRFREQRFHPKLFRGDHFVSLAPLGPGTTRIVHGADYEGWLLPHLSSWLTDLARGFVGMNQALKRAAES